LITDGNGDYLHIILTFSFNYLNKTKDDKYGYGQGAMG
jgi:hypothetical protein